MPVAPSMAIASVTPVYVLSEVGVCPLRMITVYLCDAPLSWTMWCGRGNHNGFRRDEDTSHCVIVRF